MGHPGIRLARGNDHVRRIMCKSIFTSLSIIFMKVVTQKSYILGSIKWFEFFKSSFL